MKSKKPKAPLTGEDRQSALRRAAALLATAQPPKADFNTVHLIMCGGDLNAVAVFCFVMDREHECEDEGLPLDGVRLTTASVREDVGINLAAAITAVHMLLKRGLLVRARNSTGQRVLRVHRENVVSAWTEALDTIIARNPDFYGRLV